MLVVVIDGEIGAGKTTFINLLAEELKNRNFKIEVVSEPVKLWSDTGILQAFYNDPSRWGYAFQTFTVVTRINEINKVKLNDTDIVLMERSPLTDKYVFMELQRSIIGEMFTKMYDIWWDTWIQLIPQELQKCPWKIIYLKPSLEKCMSRLINRAREGEEKITMEYQRRLRQAHKNYMKISKHQTIVISGDLVNNDFRTDENCKKLMDDVILKMNIHNKFN